MSLKKQNKQSPQQTPITSFSLLLPQLLYQTERLHFCLGVGQLIDVWPVSVCPGSIGAVESWQQAMASVCRYGLGKRAARGQHVILASVAPLGQLFSALGSPVLPAFPSPEK